MSDVSLLSPPSLLVAVHLKLSLCPNAMLSSIARVGPFMVRFVPVSVH